LTLSPGDRLGPYEILSPLGAGGMGEVYRARDTRLERTVAVKVLPGHLSASPEVRLRFEREAKTISSFSHPHICALYDVGNENGVEYLVMEYLEGETLSERLAKGALKPEETLRHGIEIAGALDGAHRQGVVHRDLKPANIMLTRTGIKLLDFGLAKVLEPEAPVESLTSAPTTAGEVTREGTILGTVSYMAPEQLEGKKSDSRTDIFALGATLYEMAAGRKAFSANSRASLISAILRDEPEPISRIHPMSPPALDSVVKTCLAKDPDDRWQSARDVGLQLETIRDSAPPSLVPPSDPARRPRRELFAWVVALTLAVLAAILAFEAVRRSGAARPGPVLAYIPPPPETSFRSFGFGQGPVVVAPEGNELAFSATDQGGITRLWVRPLSSGHASLVAGTEDAANPFWAGADRRIGFFADGKLKTVDLSDGSIQNLTSAGPYSTGTWNRAGILLFSNSTGSPIYRIPAAGGTPVAATRIEKGDTGHSHPHFLPDGKHFLYTAWCLDAPPRIEMASLDSPEPKPVLGNARAVAYAAGYLLFVRDSRVFAHRFDPAAGTLSGQPTALAEAASFSAAGGFVVAYQGGSAQGRLEWFDSNGNSQGVIGDVGEYTAPRISPDGRRVLTGVRDPRSGETDLWSFPLAAGVSTRLTFGPGRKLWSVWSPDGKFIAYGGTSKGRATLFRQLADGSGTPEALLTFGPEIGTCPVVDWSPDGRYLSYDVFNLKDSREENWVLPLLGDRKPFRVTPLDANQYDGNFSPDGRWFAYFSYETGRPEVFVVPFPGPGGKYQISQAGGWLVRWAQGGKLFFSTMGNRVMEADLALTGNSLEIKSIRALFQMAPPTLAAPLFDVSPDGQRFLAVSAADPTASRSITLLLDWTAGMKGR
jgi:Tol biopolymer transport system component/predicted Ser/Thr protein kinase